MISFIHESEQAFDTVPIAAAIHKAHMQFTEARLLDALIARFGELPSREDIAAHCLRVIDHENVSHYLWFEGEKPGPGDTVDVSTAFVSIAAPKIYDPGN